MRDLNHRSVRPEPLADLLTENYVSGAFQEHRKNAEGLFLQSDLLPSLAQFAGADVELEIGKTTNAGPADGPVRHSSLLEFVLANKTRNPTKRCATFA